MPRARIKAAAAKIDWSKIPVETMPGGLARRVVQTDQFTLVHYTYPPGATFKEHRHPEAQLTYVIRGRIAFTVNGKRWMLVPGTGSRYPAACFTPPAPGHGNR